MCVIWSRESIQLQGICPTHASHVQVGDYHVKTLMLELIEHFLTIDRHSYPVPSQLQQPFENTLVRGIIFANQDIQCTGDFTFACVGEWDGCRFRLRLSSFFQGKIDPEPAANILHAFEQEGSAHYFDEVLGDCQAETASAVAPSG